MSTPAPSLIDELKIVHCNFDLPIIQHPLSPACVAEEHPSELFQTPKGSPWSLCKARSLIAGTMKVAQATLQGYLSKERLVWFLLELQKQGKTNYPLVAIVGEPHGKAQLPVVIFAHWRDRATEPRFKRHCSETEVEKPNAGWHLYHSIKETIPVNHAFPADSKVLYLK